MKIAFPNIKLFQQIFNFKLYKKIPVFSIFCIFWAINLLILAFLSPISLQAPSLNSVNTQKVEISAFSIVQINLRDSQFLTLFPGYSLIIQTDINQVLMTNYNYSVILNSIFNGNKDLEKNSSIGLQSNPSLLVKNYYGTKSMHQAYFSSNKYDEYHLFILNHSNFNLIMTIHYFYRGFNLYLIFLAVFFFLISSCWYVIANNFNSFLFNSKKGNFSSKWFLLFNQIILPAKIVIIGFIFIFDYILFNPSQFGSLLDPLTANYANSCYIINGVLFEGHSFNYNVTGFKINYLMNCLYYNFNFLFLLILFFMLFTVPIFVRFSLQKKNRDFYTLFPISWKFFLSVILGVLLSLFLLPIITVIFTMYLYYFMLFGTNILQYQIFNFLLEISIFLTMFIITITVMTTIPKNEILGLILPFIIIPYFVLIDPFTSLYFSPYNYFLTFKMNEICTLSRDKLNKIKNIPMFLILIGLVGILILLKNKIFIRNLNEN